MSSQKAVAMLVFARPATAESVLGESPDSLCHSDDDTDADAKMDTADDVKRDEHSEKVIRIRLKGSAPFAV